MDTLESTINQFYEINELIKRLNTSFVRKIQSDIDRFGPLTESDRVHLIGILGL